MITFNKFFAEAADESHGPLAVFAFGRMNPITAGHGKLVNQLPKLGGQNHFMFLSRDRKPTPLKSGKTSETIDRDDKGYNKNPLNYDYKVELFKKMFPHINLVEDPVLNNPWDIVAWLYEEGYRHIQYLVGQDRFEDKQLKAIYPFVEENMPDLKFELYNAGVREDGDGKGKEPKPGTEEYIQSMSASKLRQFVQDNDFESFAQALPSGLEVDDVQTLWDKLIDNMPKMHKIRNRWVPVIDATDINANP
jgi:hypothetical protein